MAFAKCKLFYADESNFYADVPVYTEEVYYPKLITDTQIIPTATIPVVTLPTVLPLAVETQIEAPFDYYDDDILDW